MANVFKISIDKQVFEQDPFRRSAFVNTDQYSFVFDVEQIERQHVRFAQYLWDGDKCVGVKLTYDTGNGFDDGNIVDLKPGQVFEFEHDGVWIDDEGCPEDYFIRYQISIVPYG